MQFTEFGKQDGKTLLLLPGTACTWQHIREGSSVSKKDSDPSAPYDGYEESDDTEEKARTIRLEKKR